MTKTKILSLYLAMFLISMNFVFGQGIEFQDISFNEAKDLAKKENKLIFMDCYTSWCGPCKMLEATTFKDKEIGDHFNKKYINVKYDMEKGEGVDLAKQYKIVAFPTLLLIDGDGKVVFRTTGGPGTDKFIEVFEKGSSPEINLDILEKEYETGTISNERMLDYLLLLMLDRNMDKIFKLQKELLLKLSDEELLSDKYWEIVKIPLWSVEYPEIFLFILNHYDYYIKNIQENEVNDLISEVAWRTMKSGLESSDVFEKHEKYLPTYLELIGNMNLPDKDNVLSCFHLTKAMDSKDYSSAIDCMIKIDLNKTTNQDITSIISYLKQIYESEPLLVKKYANEKGEEVNSLEDYISKSLIANYLRRL